MREEILDYPDIAKPMTTDEFKEQTRALWAVNCGDAYIIVDGQRHEIGSVHYVGHDIVVEASE